MMERGGGETQRKREREREEEEEGEGRREEEKKGEKERKGEGRRERRKERRGKGNGRGKGGKRRGEGRGGGESLWNQTCPSTYSKKRDKLKGACVTLQEAWSAPAHSDWYFFWTLCFLPYCAAVWADCVQLQQYLAEGLNSVFISSGVQFFPDFVHSVISLIQTFTLKRKSNVP
jgi:hypothetical protein